MAAQNRLRYLRRAAECYPLSNGIHPSSLAPRQFPNLRWSSTPRATRFYFFNTVSSRSFSSQQKSQSTPSPSLSHSRRRLFFFILAPLSLAFTFPLLFNTSTPRRLNPQSYTDHPTTSLTLLPPSHALLAVSLSTSESQLFSSTSPTTVKVDGTSLDLGSDEVVVSHVMVKSPDLMIERPYTPINNVERDGELRLLVKRVKGGEVGRLVHSLKPGDPVGIRGPITTFTLKPSSYDTIIMISTGTAISPFLQLLSKLSPSSSSTSSSSPTFHLIHALPTSGKPDITLDFLTPLTEKWGSQLKVDRFDLTSGFSGVEGLNKDRIQSAIKGKTMVLVCLPPRLMRPLCGTLTPMLEQGPLTGILAELGLTADQVWKLE